jgi:hypothetical protein
MLLDEYRQRYNGMSAADVRGLISTSSEFRKETEDLYVGIYHQKLNKSCGDCWLDAYILLMKGNPEKLKAMAEKRFDLRAGAVLIDPLGDPKKTITRLNMTDELALYHLRTHPDCARLFSVLPEGWEQEAVESGIEDERKNAPAPAPSEPAEGTQAPKRNRRSSGGGNTNKNAKKAATGEQN